MMISMHLSVPATHLPTAAGTNGLAVVEELLTAVEIPERAVRENAMLERTRDDTDLPSLAL